MAGLPAWPTARVAELPRPVRLVPDETVTSFIARLAAANHVSSEDLRYYLSPGHSTRTQAAKTSLSTLEAATGYSQDALCYALPELRAQHPAPHGLQLRGRSIGGKPNTVRPACRRCMAAKEILGPVMIWMRHDHNVCVRHRIWIGPGANQPSEQLDLTAVADIIQAQQRHARLLREYGRERVHQAFADAAEISMAWQMANLYQATPYSRYVVLAPPKHPWRVYSRNPAADAASRYPDIIALTSLLASLFWRRVVISHDTAERDQFFDEIRRRVLADYVPTNSNHDYLMRWAYRQRQQHTLATLIDTLFTDTPAAETENATPSPS